MSHVLKDFCKNYKSSLTRINNVQDDLANEYKQIYNQILAISINKDYFRQNDRIGNDRTKRALDYFSLVKGIKEFISHLGKKDTGDFMSSAKFLHGLIKKDNKHNVLANTGQKSCYVTWANSFLD